MKATGQGHTGYGNSSRQWLAHVEAQKKSGLNRTEYCNPSEVHQCMHSLS